ncbi:cold-responsive protein kinase 1-like [Aegilops tauschii subsp. strangulata]|uniref:cold-responsive protein kinase 1-like n=1 Tax=Aegilops tauschii subsp. strangulata TaxID=200361 RepID=UPI003CC8D913
MPKHMSLSHGRGTFGHTAPEVWMELHIAEKCDVYSFGMLLRKIVEHGSNQDANATLKSSQQWFPVVAWARYEAGELMELMVATVRHDLCCRGLVERMCKVVFRCVQQRPSMSAVVKMLDGQDRNHSAF